MSPTIILFAKEPQQGKVKTRLIPAIGAESACALYECFLKDSITQVNRIAAHHESSVYLMITPESSKSYFETLCAGLQVNRMNIQFQHGADLGQRMCRALKVAIHANPAGAVVVGTDHPTLADDVIEEALYALSDYDSVIGPAEDGGYYLFGTKNLLTDLFENMNWSTPEVFAETRSRLLHAGVTFYTLRTWYDVDTVVELKRAQEQLKSDKFSSFSKRFLNDLKLD